MLVIADIPNPRLYTWYSPFTTTLYFITFLFQDDTDQCQFCENIIKDVRAFIDDKANQVNQQWKLLGKLISNNW